MVKKGSIHTATITDTVFPNKGVAYVDGQRIIVHDGLEGQRVRIKVTKKRGEKVEARILDILRNPPWKRSCLCSVRHLRRLHLLECTV